MAHLLRHAAAGVLFICATWIHCTRVILTNKHRLNCHVEGLPQDLDRKTSYGIIANHQTWVDVFILFYLFEGKIAFPRFFIKEKIMWFPILSAGFAALNFPVVKRYTHEQRQKQPGLSGIDLEMTKKACEIFRHESTSIVIFLEGTRFTAEKHAEQQSPYVHLLKPKAGGLAAMLSVMGEHLDCLLDVTIVYEDKKRATFWQLLSQQHMNVSVLVKKRMITPDLIGDYQNDPALRAHFQQWLNACWQEKDAFISKVNHDILAQKITH